MWSNAPLPSRPSRRDSLRAASTFRNPFLSRAEIRLDFGVSFHEHFDGGDTIQTHLDLPPPLDTGCVRSANSSILLTRYAASGFAAWAGAHYVVEGWALRGVGAAADVVDAKLVWRARTPKEPAETCASGQEEMRLELPSLDICRE